MAEGKSISETRSVRAQLGDLVLELYQVQSAIAVAVAALKHQNCELDQDIARVLQRSAMDRLHDQVERLESLARTIDPDDSDGHPL